MLDRSKWNYLIDIARDALDEAQGLMSTFEEVQSDLERAKDSAVNALEELQKMAQDAGLDVQLDLRSDSLRDLEQNVEEVESVDPDSEEETV